MSVYANNPNYKLILTDKRENEGFVRGEIWYYIKQKSNGLIFRLKTECEFEHIESLARPSVFRLTENNIERPRSTKKAFFNCNDADLFKCRRNLFDRFFYLCKGMGSH